MIHIVHIIVCIARHARIEWSVDSLIRKTSFVEHLHLRQQLEGDHKIRQVVRIFWIGLRRIDRKCFIIHFLFALQKLQLVATLFDLDPIFFFHTFHLVFSPL